MMDGNGWNGQGLEIWYMSLTGCKKQNHSSEAFAFVFRVVGNERERYSADTYDDGLFFAFAR